MLNVSFLGKPQDKKNKKIEKKSLEVPLSPVSASGSLGVESWPPIIIVVHACFNWEGHQLNWNKIYTLKCMYNLRL